MKKGMLGAGLAVLLLFFLAPGTALGQNVVPNGDIELRSLGPWETTGSTSGTAFVLYDVDGIGGTSFCYKRRPGYSPFGGGDGGIVQTVYLVAGVTYQFEADVCYVCTC
jgi:hypothetical protein